jgi:hypothetical protein
MDGVVRAPSLFSMTLVAAVHDGDAAVGGAEVDADDLAHGVFGDPSFFTWGPLASVARS